MVQDTNGCIATFGSIVVNEPSLLEVVIDTFKNESCAGIVDGFINSSATGGTAAYRYAWSTGATTQNVSNLVAATYTITITDANNCVAVDTITINDIPTININTDGIDSVSCNGLSDGAVNLTTTGGANGYSYAWSTGATTDDINGLVIGSYTITVTDALGCSVTGGAYNVFQPAILSLTANTSNVTCNGAGDGAIDVITIGGTANYRYTWNPNIATTEDLTNLNGATYNVTVTDFNGCTFALTNLVVGEPSAITLTNTGTTGETCDGANDGAIDMTTIGGEPALSGYVYNWSNGQTTADLTTIDGGTYMVTVTDSLGCSQMTTINVYNPTALVLSIVPTIPLEGCLGQAIGQLDALGSGGTGSLNYLWSNSVTTIQNTALNAGTYILTLTDSLGCNLVDSGMIGVPLMPSVSPYVNQVGTTDITINWGDVATLDVGNDQSTSGVTYNWAETTSIGDLNISNSIAINPTVQPQPNNTAIYTVLLTATSGDGCVDTASVTVRVDIADLLGMPTAFTPNGDGNNDNFRPVNLDPQFIKEFRIYNRFGQLVYDNANTSNGGWDGRLNTVSQPRDVYLYILRYELPGQDEKSVRGHVTLLR
jgi:gliding motility-associated-like protein